MDTTVLIAAASQAGVTGAAMIDALARGQTYFAAKEMTPEQLTVWVTELRQSAPHLFALPTRLTAAEDVAARYGVPFAVWEKMSPADRMARAREGAPPVVRQKPTPFIASPEQLKQLEGKSPHERRAQVYQWQQEAQQGGSHG